MYNSINNNNECIINKYTCMHECMIVKLYQYLFLACVNHQKGIFYL